MATVKKNAAVSNDVEIVEKNDAKETTKSPTFVDGVYTEYDVELTNGTKVNIEVIVDKRQLPASYGSLLSEANGPAIVMATLTARTRRILDWAGATLADIEDVLPGVINRGQEFSEDN